MRQMVAALRAVGWRDWAMLAQLSRQAFPDATRRHLSQTLRSPRDVVVLDVEGQAAGYCALNGSVPRVCWLDWLVVAPEYRGYGYGKRLLWAGESVAAARGFGCVKLAVLKNNPRAYRFYLNNGFEHCSEDARKDFLRKPLRPPELVLPVWLPRSEPNRLRRGWRKGLYWLIVELNPLWRRLRRVTSPSELSTGDRRSTP